MKHLFVFSFLLLCCQATADWPQGGGPAGDFETIHEAPTHWSVVDEKNIAWRVTLPETGQSTPVITRGKVFFSTIKEVEGDAELANDIVAWCCDSKTGKVLWRREIKGKFPLRISGAFSDSSSPPAVCDGERVVFINASGTIACFDLDGVELWNRELLSVGRTLPLKFSARTMKRDSPTFSRLQLPLMDFFSISAPLLMTSAPERQIDCEGVS